MQVVGYCLSRGLLELGHAPQAWRGQAFGEGGKVFFQTGGLGVDDIGHPSRQRQTVPRNGFGGQQGGFGGQSNTSFDAETKFEDSQEDENNR